MDKDFDILKSYQDPNFFKKFLDNFSELIFCLTDDGYIHYVNGSVLEFLGFEKDEVLNMHIHEIDPTYNANQWKAFLGLMKIRKTLAYQSSYRPKSGRLFPVEVSIKYMDFNDNDYYFLFANDVSEAKHVETILDNFFSVSMDLQCVADFDGYFKYLSPTWEKVLGYTKEELLSKPYLHFVHPEDKESTLKEAQKLTEGEQTMGFENRYICKDGSVKWLSWKATASFPEKLIYAAAKDITDWKQFEKKLSKAKGLKFK